MIPRWNTARRPAMPQLQLPIRNTDGAIYWNVWHATIAIRTEQAA